MEVTYEQLLADGVDKGTWRDAEALAQRYRDAATEKGEKLTFIFPKDKCVIGMRPPFSVLFVQLADYVITIDADGNRSFIKNRDQVPVGVYSFGKLPEHLRAEGSVTGRFPPKEETADDAWRKMFPKVADPRAFTAEEMREKFLQHVRSTVDYWATVHLPPERNTIKQRCDGVAFSILTMLDGSNIGLPSFDVIASPHPEDKQFALDEGTNWVEPGTMINADVHLHDLYYKK